jgi:MoaA/NifB/PqqE/SkfB family radical SAM enzyme
MKPHKESPTFCSIPFVSLEVNTDGSIRPCCMIKGQYHQLKKDNGDRFTVKDNLKDAWNSNELRKMRLAMINGEKLEGCNVCYLQESSGRTSNREYANEEWFDKLGEKTIESRVDQAILNAGEIDFSVAYLDLRLGNLCNLKCRMCSPFNSSQIAKEHLDLEQRDSAYKVVWASTFGKFDSRFNDMQEWFDKDVLWDQIIDMIPSLKKVYMTGGEPTLIENNFKFMQACIDKGRTDIVLFFNTNCTNVNKKFTSLISQFDRVNINASIDGVGNVNDYIRAPSKWSQISRNIETLAEIPNVHLGVTPTVQIYNIFNLVKMLDWVQSLNKKYNRRIFIDFLINVHPHHLAVGILPDDIRHRVAIELIDYKNTYFHKHTPSLTLNSVNGIIGLLQQSRKEDWKEQLVKFKIYTNSLDKERNQSLSSISEELDNL